MKFQVGEVDRDEDMVLYYEDVKFEVLCHFILHLRGR